MIAPAQIEHRDGEAGRPLTVRQSAILDVIGRYYEATLEPCPASYLARRMSLHHSTIQEHLARLHRKGWLRAPNAPAMLRQQQPAR